MVTVTTQSESATNADLAARIQQALANAAQLPAHALEAVLAAAEQAGISGGSDYTLLLGEWFAASSREHEAAQQALRRKARDFLAETQTGVTRDSSDLAQLLNAMWRLKLEKSAEYKDIYLLWLARFPQDALRSLVADWVRRWHNQHGQFVGFLATYLLAEFGAELGGDISPKQVDAALAQMAAQGQIVSARIEGQVAMYATATWLARGNSEAMSSEVGTQSRQR